MVSYFSAPNFVNSCGKHASGELYRIFPEFIKDEDFEQKLKGYFSALGIEHIHQVMASLRCHFLDSILQTFNSTTGKPDRYEKVIDWPEIIVDEAKLNIMKNIFKEILSFIPYIDKIPYIKDLVTNILNDRASEYTLTSFIEVFGNVLNGNIKSNQFWEVLKHLDNETYGIKVNLDSSKEFSLRYIAHYHTTAEFDHDFLDGKKSNNDKLIKKILSYKDMLQQSKEISDFIKKQIDNITSQYKIIINPNHEYHIITEDIEPIRNKIERLIESAPEVLKLMEKIKFNSHKKDDPSNYINPGFDSEFTSNNGTEESSQKASNTVSNKYYDTLDPKAGIYHNYRKILFYEDFESDLSKWNGGANGYHNGIITVDPMDINNSVLTFTNLKNGGDTFSNVITNPSKEYILSFDYLGIAKPGNNPKSTGGFIGYYHNFSEKHYWLAGTQQYPQSFAPNGVMIPDLLLCTEKSEHITIRFNAVKDIVLMIEDAAIIGGVAGDAFFDNIELCSINSSEY